VQHISDLHSKFAPMCGSMVNIQCATTEIRREKKKEEAQNENIMSASATQGGDNYYFHLLLVPYLSASYCCS